MSATKRNELEKLIERCIAKNITESEMERYIYSSNSKSWIGGRYIYLEYIALENFLYALMSHFSQGCGFDTHRVLFYSIRRILSGKKSYSFTLTVRLPSDDVAFDQAKWLLDIVHDSAPR